MSALYYYQTQDFPENNYKEYRGACEGCPVLIRNEAPAPRVGTLMGGCWIGLWNGFPYSDQPYEPPEKCVCATALKAVEEDRSRVLIAISKS